MKQIKQIQRNKLRTVALLMQFVCAETKIEKKELAEELAFWHNQNRMAEAIAKKRESENKA